MQAWMQCSQPQEAVQSPDLFSSENYEWEAIQNLDQFFIRVYRSEHMRHYNYHLFHLDWLLSSSTASLC